MHDNDRDGAAAGALSLAGSGSEPRAIAGPDGDRRCREDTAKREYHDHCMDRWCRVLPGMVMRRLNVDLMHGA